METTREYNNHILTDQERKRLTIIADETIQSFAESIDGMHKVMQEFPPSQNQEFNHIMNTMNDVSTFISYSFGDCIVLTKYFLNTEIQYEKSFLRGKLKVQLNESFKRLYGFNEKAHKESYCGKLQEIIHMFPGFKLEFEHILSNLDDLSKQDLTSLRHFMETNKMDKAIVTSISKSGPIKYGDLTYQFIPVACYAYIVGYNTLQQMRESFGL